MLSSTLTRGALSFPLFLAGSLVLAGCAAKPSEPNVPPSDSDGAPANSASESRFTYAGDESPNNADAPGAATSDTNASDACEVEVAVVTRDKGDGTLQIFTKLENTTSRSLTLKWTAACPGPGIAYEGIRPGYDFGNTCAAGVCMGSDEHFSLEVGPGQRAAVAELLVKPKGDGCNKGLVDGTYQVTATSEVSGAKTCPTRAATFTVSGGKATSVED